MNEAPSQQVSYPPAQEAEPKRPEKASGARIASALLGVAAIALAGVAYQEYSALSDTRAQLAQASSGVAQAKIDLAKANTQSSEFQSELAKATAASDDLRAQLKSAQSRQSDLQSQLEKARGQLADAQSQRDTAKAQSTDLQAQLAKANDGSSGLQRELDDAKAQTADLQSRLAKAQDEIARLQPVALKARAMPVSTAFKKSFWGNGITLRITNRNPDPLKVTVAVAGSAKTPAKSATIDAGSTFDVDDLSAGARVVISSEGFDPLNLTAR